MTGILLLFPEEDSELFEEFMKSFFSPVKNIGQGSNHPLTRSFWIWPEGTLYLNNCLAQFRRDFELSKVPAKAPFFLTADQSYRLFVNGKYVCRGPARGYQSHWPFDEIDLRSYLKTGHNFIAVEAYNPGVGTFSYIHEGDAGFLCAAEWEELQIHSNKEEWKMRRSPGNRSDVARFSFQMGYQEDFDASRDDLSWITSETPPAWKEPERFRWRGILEFGRPPWDSVEARGIPFLRESLCIPFVSAWSTGKMSSGWRDCFNIAWQWAGAEYRSIRQWFAGDSLPARKTKDGLCFIATPVPGNEFRAITLSLGEIRIGTLGIELENCTGEEIVDCYYHQSVPDGIPTYMLPVGVGELALATRLRTASGKCGRMFYSLQGTREITLIFRAVSRPLKVKAVWRLAEYPFLSRGKFETSDRELNEIWQICRATQQACASDAYMDTPWREQGQWWGDARVQARNSFFLDGDPRLLVRGIRSIAGQSAPNGLTSGVAPCCRKGMILPDFSLTWILTIYDLYWQTGSLKLFREQHRRIRRILSYFDKSMQDGIIHVDSRYWLFEDWADLPKEGFPTFLNLWHLYVLMHYQKLLSAAGLDDTRIGALIAFRSKLLTDCFFDADRGLFIAGRDDSGNELKTPSVHDQVLAILCGLVPKSWESMVEKRLLPFLRDEKCDYACPTSFWCTYLFEAARKLGYDREVLHFIRTHWSRMVPDGGTWEHLNWVRDEGQSCSHAWSAHPLSHLVEILLGLEQLAPAWTQMAVSPQWELLPDSGRICFPAPQGVLEFEWVSDCMTIICPERIDIIVHNKANDKKIIQKKEGRS